MNEVFTHRYQITGKLEENPESIAEALRTKGRFIIATNELDLTKLSLKEMLSNYKEQQAVERGFQFLKDSSFMTSSVFLKNQERIVALSMIMCLCLLVYTIAQRYMLKKLQELRASVPNQLEKPTQKPNMRWIFQLFEDVHLLLHIVEARIREIVLNLNAVRLHILAILGSRFEKMYSTA